MKNKRQNVKLFNELHKRTIVYILQREKYIREKCATIETIERTMKMDVPHIYCYTLYRLHTKHCHSWHTLTPNGTTTKKCERVSEQASKREIDRERRKKLHLRIIENTNKTQKDMPLPKNNLKRGLTF